MDMTPGSQRTLASASARELLHGALRTSDEGEGWVRPWRFSPIQMRALGSCQAWHPGLYRQMARTTAGVTLEFTTDSSEFALELLLDDEPRGTRAVLDYVDPEGEAFPHDGVSCEVDGRHLGLRQPSGDDDCVVFSLDDPDAAPADGVMQLPGMGDTHHVRIWLPCLRGCRLRDVVGNGSFVRGVAARRELLVLGDSIAQGFVSDDPFQAWPALLASRLDLDLVNQGIGGQVFQPGTLLGLAQAVDPACIVVELGANYRYEPCRERLVTRDVRGYLLELSRLWSRVPIWVMSPLWHDEEAYPSHSMSCWRSVPLFLAAHCAPHDQMTLLDGGRLLDHRASLMADGFEHPNAEGSRQLARRLWVRMMMRRGDVEERRTRAQTLLEGAPRRCFPLQEELRRGIGEVLFAEEGCVALSLVPGQVTIWGRDRELAHDVLLMLDDVELVYCLEPALVRDVCLTLGLESVSPVSICVCQGRPKPAAKGHRPSRPREVRPLDASFASVVRERYSHPEYLRQGELEGLLKQGLLLGGFEGGELVGFVGEHPGGSMGMLEVFPEHRGRGWGEALERAKIEDQLARGLRPWCEVWPENRDSLRLQRRLGLKVQAANESCYISRAPEAGEVVAPEGAGDGWAHGAGEEPAQGGDTAQTDEPPACAGDGPRH